MSIMQLPPRQKDDGLCGPLTLGPGTSGHLKVDIYRVLTTVLRKTEQGQPRFDGILLGRAKISPPSDLVKKRLRQA